MTKQKWPLRWDLLLRYRLIEIIALWEGRLTTNHLCNTFGIGRQQASGDINNYIREIAPGNLEYDRTLKGYRPTPQFTPKVTLGVVDDYLHLMARNKELSSAFEQLSLQITNTEVLHVPTRNEEPETIRPIVTAARQQKRLDVDYVSIQNPSREGRIIVPHTLVYTGFRWHVRAWCEKNQEYRDFVLSRFRGIPDMMEASPNGAENDTAWNTRVTLKIKPDPRLKKEQRAVIANDYGMKRGVLKIETRAALAQYVLQALRIEVHTIHAKPEAQQIVVANLDEVKEWMFS
jgi:predicted DNA-binding transcriptional regulator YafY